MTIENILKLIRPEFLEMNKYIPPKTGFNNGEKIISLSANENPYCFKEDEDYNKYPDLESKNLKNKLSTIYNISQENILCGRGSSEMIELLTKLFCTPFKDKAIICSPTYMMYPRVLKIEGVECIDIKLKDNLQLDKEKIIEVGKNKDVKLIFIPNPNAPLGHIMNKDDILHIAKELENDCCIVIDEAYIEWTDAESFIPYIENYNNICVLRTLSKYYGLANLRIGVFVGHEEIKNNLEKIMSPYSIPSVVSNIAVEALDEKYFGFYKKNKELVLFWKDKIIEELQKLDFIEKVYLSKTNFITAISPYRDSIIKYLEENNVVVIPQHLKNSLRISIGLPEENEKLIKLLKNYKIL